MKTLSHLQDQEEILSRVGRVRPDSVRRWGRMSAHQMVCHLSDGYKLYMGMISAVPPGFPYPSRVLKICSLWIPVRWPKNFKTVREVNQEIGGTAPRDFYADIHDLKTEIKRFVRRPCEFTWPMKHPFLGTMFERDWMRLGYLHADHHLRQFGL